MVHDNSSPEEKLFKIIQEEKKSPSGGGGAQSKRRNPKALSRGLKEAILSWKDGLISSIRLKTVNIGLSLLLLLLFCFVMYYGMTKYPTIAKITSAASKAQNGLSAEKKKAEELHPPEYYTAEASLRDIFSPGHMKQGSVSAGGAMAALGGPSGDLKLVGIAWSDTPKALIQSEKEKDQLYVVKEGQLIGTTGVRVRTILHNKVIVSSGDKEFEL